MADPMVERFEFASIHSHGTLVANRLQQLPPFAIRISFLLLFVRMINGKVFAFETNAQICQQKFTDALTARGKCSCVYAALNFITNVSLQASRFERHDSWISTRFRKAREYSLRMCANLTIIKLAYGLANDFLSVSIDCTVSHWTVL